VTDHTHRISHPRIIDDCHWSSHHSSDTDLEAQQVVQAPPEMNIDQSRSRDDVGHTTGDRLPQAEAQIRACFLTIVDISMT
jgi:hypothetical protein